MFVNGGGKGLGRRWAAGLAALVLGVAGGAAAVIWLRQGGMLPGALAGVLLPLALVAGPIRGWQVHSRMRMQAMLDQFAERQMARERLRQTRLSSRDAAKVRK
jgi:hypothetical protein